MIERRKKLFVTGATGFLGRHFILDAEWNEFDFYILTRNKGIVTSFFADRMLTVLEGTLGDIGNFSRELSECDYFVHITGEKKDESRMEEINVYALKRILKEISSFPRMKFMLISSAGVYGIRNQAERFLAEDTPCKPLNYYEKTKLEGEKVLVEWAEKYGFKYVILRPTNIFGEHDRSHKLLNLMKALKRGMFFYLDRQAWVNYVYVKYVTSVMWQLIRSDRFKNEVYNVNSPVTIYSFIELLKKGLYIERKTRSLPSWLIWPLAFLCDKLLPKKIQAINMEKYRELLNKQVYPIDKIKNVVVIDEEQMLKRGLENLAVYYEAKNLL